ncbi:energy transducer TonB [Spirosoma endophyticum]|uniref:TonB protein C-terminal n=1 Tax=Spirosoma endophyticum TaxID=662367 RepID=A0A1I2HT03_9BACT|nr:energy transducer TonB [Spirosoma endophyticum]SFF31531.1 TonB protein C-terminal [Spirosoma endophyticum]
MSLRFLQLLFIFLSGANSISLGQTINQPKQTDTTAYAVVQVPPKFPGGPDAMFQFIQSTSRYPVNLKKGPLTWVKLLVEKDGSISNVQVTYTEVDDKLVSEAKRVVELMPKWTPGSQDGRLLRAYTSIPIRFVKAQ